MNNGTKISKLQFSQGDSWWFWELTTKWWFLPVFYFSLVLIYSLLFASISPNHFSFSHEFWETLSAALIFMPVGLAYYVELPLYLVRSEPLDPGLGLSFFPISLVIDALIIFSMAYIPYRKNKRDIVPKWLIITIYLLIVLSFFGAILSLSDFFFPVKVRPW